MTTKANDPAFPLGGLSKLQIVLTKRELFAAMAMQGLLSSAARWPVQDNEPRMAAKDALKLADALIKALEESGSHE